MEPLAYVFNALTRTPTAVWRNIQSLEGAILAGLVVIAMFSHPLAKRLQLRWEGLGPKWPAGLLAALFVWSFFGVVYRDLRSAQEGQARFASQLAEERSRPVNKQAREAAERAAAAETNAEEARRKADESERGIEEMRAASMPRRLTDRQIDIITATLMRATKRMKVELLTHGTDYEAADFARDMQMGIGRAGWGCGIKHTEEPGPGPGIYIYYNPDRDMEAMDQLSGALSGAGVSNDFRYKVDASDDPVQIFIGPKR